MKRFRCLAKPPAEVPVGYFQVALFLFALTVPVPPTAAFEPGSEEFFEQKIRPVLIQHCYQCHSSDAKEVGGKLWLDSRDAMRAGGDSGPAITVGDAENSVLIAALRYQSSEMPPDQPLADEVIDDFVRWIDAGAVDPRQTTTEHPSGHPADKIDLDQGRQFWAFRPVGDFRIDSPADVNAQRADSMIDERLNRRMDDHGLRPNSIATPETRLRRLCFDLTGLPPQPSMRDAWLQSPTPQTWSTIVDQLLDSREFAQHWARHWMDVARYADSNGSDFNATFHDAWRYRDYLIDSFDQDRPLDQMIRQQVAGDLMPAENDQQRRDNVVATTFLMLGPKMLSERNKEKLILDVVDEQIDTIGRAFLGMTLGCARCHDHKFDPIPTEDYYALAGIFQNTQTLNGESQKYVSTWNRVELPTTDEHKQSLKAHQTRSAELQRRIDELTKQLQHAQQNASLGIVVDDSEATKIGKWVASTYTKGFIGSGYVHDDNGGKGECSIEFRKRLPASGTYQVRFAFSHNGNRAANVPVTIHTADGPQSLSINQREKPDAVPWKLLGAFEFSADQDAVVTIRNDQTSGYVIADAIEFVSLDASSNPATASQGDGAESIAAITEPLEGLKQELKSHIANPPPPLPYAMAPSDYPADKIHDHAIRIRGEVNNRGDVVPRGFLQVCGPGDAAIVSPVGSGRLELANWLTDPDHPLVARVMVNRIWMHLFGEGIVRTVDNFGSRGQAPSHPQLLDALAIDFTRGGWQLKPLVRRIVLSDAYNRSSHHNEASYAIDPENRLLWRAHRKRLNAESIRDAMLVAAAAITTEERTEPVADKGVLVTANKAETEAVASGIDQPVRSIYLPVIRGYVPALMASLDAADPDLLVGKRPVTNVPGQALVLINSEEVIAWSRETANQIYSSESNWPDRLQAVFVRCLAREATPQDMDLAEHYLGLTPQLNDEQGKERLADFVAAMFAATEFRLLD